MQDNASAAVSVPQLRARFGAARAGAWPKAPALRSDGGDARTGVGGRDGGIRFRAVERPPEALDAAMARLFGSGGRALLSGAGTEAAEAFTLAACGATRRGGSTR